jgi:2-oxoglutarate ferredoxin oxidoreductase subunit delta
MAEPEEATDRGQSARDRAEPLPEIVVKVSWCKGCGLCVEYCNRDVLVMEGVLPKVVAAEKCTSCLQCEVICPDFAIEVRDAGAVKVSGSGGPGS